MKVAQKIDRKLLSTAKAIVGSMVKGDARVADATAKAESAAGASTLTLVKKMLGGRNEPVTDKVWRSDYQPAFTLALNEAYPDGYGPRLSHIRVMTIGTSHGIEGPSGRRQYYEATLPVLVERGLIEKAKAGRPSGQGAGKTTSKGGAVPKAVQQANRDAGATFKPGKAYSDADYRAAACILSGAPASAAMIVRCFRDNRDQTMKALRVIDRGE
jgi:hypothetical protein